MKKFSEILEAASSVSLPYSQKVEFNEIAITISYESIPKFLEVMGKVLKTKSTDGYIAFKTDNRELSFANLQNGMIEVRTVLKSGDKMKTEIDSSELTKMINKINVD